jgi:signal transduction histidine kinase
MALALPCRELFASYSGALEAWLTRRQESELLRARALGETALRQGIRACDLTALHHESLRHILNIMHKYMYENAKHHKHKQDAAALLRTLSPSDAVAAAGLFFAESMAPFEAQERELRRSNAALQYQNHKLEGDIHRFTEMIYNEGMQLLAAARLAMAEAAFELKPSVPVSFDEVQKILELVEDKLAACSDNLRPRVLDDLGPRAAVQSLCRRFSQTTGVDVKAELGIFPVRADVGLALYKAVLEALTNIERHARANRVRIWLYEENSVIHCFVQDDGVGFDVPKVLSGLEFQGSGLGSMAESLRSIGGKMVIDSMLGSGAEIKISIDQQILNPQTSV